MESSQEELNDKLYKMSGLQTLTTSETSLTVQLTMIASINLLLQLEAALSATRTG